MLKLPGNLYEKILQSIGAGSTKGPSRRPKVSAAVLPWRRREGHQEPNLDGQDIEVYWIRRAPGLPFMGGWHAFPGGGLAKSDKDLHVAGQPEGVAETTHTPGMPGLDDEGLERLGPDLVPGLLGCALRELFEETGLLPLEDGAPQPERLASARLRLLAKEVDFSALLAQNEWTPTASRLVFAGRWLTPPLAPVRFDNRFFLLEWNAKLDPAPTVDGHELDHGEWIRPAEALAAWERGEILAAPPILHLLRVLAEDGPEAGRPRLVDTRETYLGPRRRVEFRPGVLLLPLRTPTLPPAENTNAFLLGHGEKVLVDPATPLPEEIQALREMVQAANQDGGRVKAIWLTHHHPDHVGAVEAMREHLGVPVLAHRESIAPLAARGIRVDEELQDEQRIVLAGEPDFPIRVFHTPGHARGHLSFLAETSHTLITGDLIAGVGTIVIDPPEGDMDAYLDSLARMEALAPSLLLPSHGPPLARQASTLTSYQRHRLEREEEILQAWTEGHRDPDAIVRRVYAEIPAAVHPIARRQAEAHLQRLQKLGKIER